MDIGDSFDEDSAEMVQESFQTIAALGKPGPTSGGELSASELAL